MIDLHAHILPGLDDGPEDLDACAALAVAAVRAETSVLAATSHVNQGFGLSPADLAAGRRAVRARLAADGIPLEVVQGGEISTNRLGTLDDADLRALTLGDGPWVLLECPFSPAAAGMELMVGALHERGFEVLLAHPERSPSFQRQPALLATLIERGALGQVNSASLVGEFGDAARRAAFTMVEQGLVHVLASDAHDAVHRPPGVAPGLAALRERFGRVAALGEWMTNDVPAAILAGLDVPERPPLEPKRRHGLLRRLRA